MNKKGFIHIVLVIIIIAVVAIGSGYFFFSGINKTENNFQYNEIIKEKIGVNGGILQNAEKTVIVTIPPLKKETEFTLSFKRSDFEVRSGIGSPVTISIYPDINLMDSPTPINIKVKYDAKYNFPVPYLINKKNKLRSVDLIENDKKNHYFTMNTFHGGNYSWIYAIDD